MSYYGHKSKYNLSQKKITEYKRKMREIEKFCKENNIKASYNYNNYEFELNGIKYTIQNCATPPSTENEVFIYAGKTRLIEIYDCLKAGKKIDRRGNVIY